MKGARHPTPGVSIPKFKTRMGGRGPAPSLLELLWKLHWRKWSFPPPPKKKGPNEYFIARASEAAESEWKIFDVWQVGAQKLATRRATAVLGAHWVTEHSGRSGESTWPGKEFHCSCSSICISYQCFAHRAEKVQDPFVAHGHLLWSLWDCACHGTKENIFGGPCSRCWGQVLRPAHASKEPFRMCQKLHGGSHAALHFLLLSSCAYCIKVLYKNKLAYKYFHILFSVIESVGKGKYSGEGWEKVKGVKVRVLYKRKLL